LQAGANDVASVAKVFLGEVVGNDVWDAETALVEGDHLINPAHPAALEFVDRIVAGNG
jgi:hypothetical protein